ncbi:MAG: hypothetical protein CMH54_02925 [Myxococcales bacterium]|nr:hypothetical protein [Myxococcales bacterium]
MTASIPPEEQRRCLLWLRKAWSRINGSDLSDALTPPVFSLDPGTHRLGHWNAQTRTLGISLHHIRTATALEVEQTLRHEMAHQFVSEGFGAENAQPHGALFRKACKLLGVHTPSATSSAGNRAVERVQKLLRLSNSPNRNEAETAMASAFRLMLKHNITQDEVASPDDYGFAILGSGCARIPLEHKLVASILQEFFFVQCIWISTDIPSSGRKVRVLEALGRPENLKLARYTHTYLHRVLDELWAEYRRNSGKLGRTARKQFRVGVLMGFRERLRQQKTKQQERGLIWLGDRGLSDFLRTRHPRCYTMRSAGYRTGRAHSDGLETGRKLRIRPGLTDPPKKRGLKLTKAPITP